MLQALGRGNDPSIGIAQMKLSTFVEVTFRHPRAFDVSFSGNDASIRNAFFGTLSDEGTAIRYAAAHLSDLNADLPRGRSFRSSTGLSFTRPELVAFGYNAGAQQMRQVASGYLSPPSLAYILHFRQIYDAF